MIQRTLILDTNVYGELLVETNGPEVVKGIKEDKAVYVYGLDIIEDELKASPATVKFKSGLLREAVLSIRRGMRNEAR